MAAPENKAKAGRFKKGESGNPGGRPKIDIEVRAAAREQTHLAIQTLIEVCKGKKAPAAAKVSAASALLDRGWGKPTQQTEITGKDGGPIEAKSALDTSALTVEQLRALASIPVPR